MAGILDSTPMGILDPRSSAIMQMGFSLLGQGPSTMPVSFGQSLGQAGMQGLSTAMSVAEANRKAAQTQALIDLEKAKAAQTAQATQVSLAQINMQRQLLGLPPLGGQENASGGGSGTVGFGGGMPSVAPQGGAAPNLMQTIQSLPTEHRQAAMADIAMNGGKNLASIIQKASEPIIGREGGIYERIPGGGMQLNPGWIAGEEQRQRLQKNIENENTIVQEPTGRGAQQRIMTKAAQLRQASGQTAPVTGNADMLTSVPTDEQALNFVKTQAQQGRTATAFVDRPNGGYVVGKSPEQAAAEEGQKAESTKLGTGLGEAATKVINDAAASSIALRDLTQASELTKNFTPDKLSPLKQSIGEWAISLKLMSQDDVNKLLGDVKDMKTLASKFDILAAKMVRQTDSQPAARQLDMIRAAMPSNASVALQDMIDLMRDSHIYNIEKLRAQESFRASHNGSVDGFEAEWTKISKDLPLFMEGKRSSRDDSKPQPEMNAMPPAAKHKGRIIEDSNGQRYKSDGMTWRKL